MKRIVLTWLVFAGYFMGVAAASAGTLVHIYITVPNPGVYNILAQVTTDGLGPDTSAGLAGFGFDLIGPISTLDHLSPRDPSAVKSDVEGPTGFTLARSADNLNFVAGFQDIANPDMIPIYGFGQRFSSFDIEGITVGGTVEPPSRQWGPPSYWQPEPFQSPSLTRPAPIGPPSSTSTTPAPKFASRKSTS